MIVPPLAGPPQVGPLAAPTEAEVAEAYERLQGETLTLAWAAERLGMEVARVELLVRAGELLAIPGPWPLRQAHRTGLGYFVPAWQLAGRGPRPELPALLRAAAAAGWSSLDLHRFMTDPRPGGATPARLLRAGELELVLGLIRDGGRPLVPAAPERSRRRPPRARRRPHLRAAARGRIAA